MAGMMSVFVASALAAAVPGGQPPKTTIMQALSGGMNIGIDDGATFHSSHFTEAAVGTVDVATKFEMTAAAASDDARCLDGSPGAYYFQPGNGTGTNKWYIHQVSVCPVVSTLSPLPSH